MKLFYKITISLIITIILIFIADIIFFYYVAIKQQDVYISQEKYSNDIVIPPIYLHKYFFHLKRFKDLYQSSIVEMRPIENVNSKESPILIFGCSYASGYVFDNQETISYVMSKYSKRPIINRAVSGWGIQHMLYQLENDKQLILSTKKPRYIFYVLMDDIDHFERLCLTNFPNILDNFYYLTYKIKDGKLVERKPFLNLYYNFAIIRHIQNTLISNKVSSDIYITQDKKIFNLFILHFESINNLIEKYWAGDSKEKNKTEFIILDFGQNFNEYWEPQLEAIGINVINIPDLIGKNLEDIINPKLGLFEPEICPHPNGKLWQLVVPKLKELYPDL